MRGSGERGGGGRGGKRGGTDGRNVKPLVMYTSYFGGVAVVSFIRLSEFASCGFAKIRPTFLRFNSQYKPIKSATIYTGTPTLLDCARSFARSRAY